MCVVEQVARGLAHHLVLQDERIAADQLPAGEEGRPVDVVGEVLQVPGVERPHADEAGLPDGRLVRCGPPAIVARLPDRGARLDLLAARILFTDFDVFVARGRFVPGAVGLGQQAGNHAHRAAGVDDIGGGAASVRRLDLHRRVGPAGRRPADQQGDVKAAPLHLGGHEHHLVQRRGDQAGQADDVDLVRLGLIQNAVGRDHDAQVDHLVVVALKHDADDVLADVVDVALDGGHQDAAGLFPRLAGFLRLHEGFQPGHRLLHHPRRLHHLRQEHLARAEQVADHVHAVHQGPLDDVQRPLDREAGFFGVGLDVFGDAIDQRVLDALAHRLFAPFQVHDLGRAFFALVAGSHVHQPLGVGHVGPLRPIQDHVLDRLAQGRIDVVIDGQVAGVDDAHVHARRDGVVQEDRVDRPSHRLVAAEAERHVRHPARDAGVGQGGLDDLDRLDEVDGVVVVLLDPRRHGEDVGVEDDVLGRKAHLVHQDAVGAGADLDLARGGIGLAHFVKGHDHDGRAVSQAGDGLFAELGLALLHGDGVDDGLALHTLQPGLDHLPLGGIDHHRHAGDVGLGRDQLQEGAHGDGAVQQPFVHVDVDDLGARLDLLARDVQRGRVVPLDDQLPELGRTGDVGPLADVDEDRTHQA